MIQPAAPSSASPALTVAVTVAGQPGESVEPADFAALLNIQTLTAGPTEDAPVAQPGLLVAATAALPVPANGKILPVGLPVALPSEAPAAQAQPVDQDPAAAPPAALPSAVATLPTALLKARPAGPAAQAAPADAPQPTMSEDVAEPADPAIAVAEPLATLPVIALHAVTPVSQPASPGEPASPAETALSREPGRPTQAPIAASPQPAMSQPAVTQPAVSAAGQQTPPPSTPQLTALPEAAPAEREAAVQQVRMIEPAAAQPVAASETVLAAPPVIRDAAPAAFTATTAAAERPHDFTALVDRLVAAREAMQPQSVTMAVRHAEFGAVQLRFQQDASGLSVAMASADPDFARAVSAAVPPVQPASASDTASFSQQGRSEAGHGGTAEGFAQSRSGQQTPREERAAARANPSPAAGRSQSEASDDGARNGIFA
ncbi:hypothetical protein [Novosphingobium arvoryzae]|uniref:hypothetical protein n=1 Tax=Novosphingobium arvoryzae TaxID=1256514 RepID=UPI0035B1BDD4